MPLSEFDLQKWYNDQDFPEQTVNLINNIRTSNPSRNVGGGVCNVSGKYPSKRMGLSIQFESSIELAGIWQMEESNEVLEYYDQPGRVKLKYQSRNDKIVGVYHTPDFFVINKNSAGWEEWKTEEELIELSVEQPNRYKKDTNGNWYCPPGQEYADKFGLYYRLRSSAELNWIYLSNLSFLEDYFRLENPIVEQRNEVLKVITDKPGINLKELLEECSFSPDDLYTLIALKEIYVDLYNIKLTDRNKMLVFLNEEIANGYEIISSDTLENNLLSGSIIMEIGVQVFWDSREYTIVNFDEDRISLAPDEGKLITLSRDIFTNLVNSGAIKGTELNIGNDNLVQDILKKANAEDLATANQRFKIIAPLLNGAKKILSDFPERTLREWVRKYKIAKEILGNGYIGLIPKSKMKGNRNRKLPEDTLILMEEFIKNHYENPNQKTKMAVFGALLSECERRGIVAPNYKTFVKAINSRPVYEQTLKRKGRKAAYKYEEFYWRLGPNVPRHGERPFEISHIDHTELDIELIDSDTGNNIGRPWLSILIDAFSRRILAIYLTFDAPSYRSCMMLFEECVKRFNRLPQTIVVDGGREFKSIYFETFLARYEVSKKTRPASKSRFGSVCERIFGTTNTRFIHNLTGNTQIMKDVRQVTKDVNPKKRAVWTLEALDKNLREWVYKSYDNAIHSTLGQSPRETFINGIALTGNRSYRLIPYNDEFLIYLLPTTKKGQAKVQPGRGVKINCKYYWCNEFKMPDVENTKVQVRYDPFNAAIAYAYINDQWVQCISEYFNSFYGKSEKEIRIATAIVRKRNRSYAENLNATAKQLAEQVNKAEGDEELLKQQIKDKELKKSAFNLIDNTLQEKLLVKTPVEIDLSRLKDFEEF